MPEERLSATGLHLLRRASGALIASPTARVTATVMTVLIALAGLASYLRYASPGPAYIATRDAYARTFADSDVAGDERARTAHEAALDDLEARMRRAIGPLHIDGFADDGRINLTSLSPGGAGYGMLDGLVYASPDGKRRVLATTSELLFRWLWAHKDLLQPLNSVLKSDDFYTNALYPDAYFLTYAELPVKPPEATFAAAMLFAHAREVGPTTPDEIAVTVVHEMRVFIATAPAAAKIDVMPDCEPLWRDAHKEAERIFGAYVEADGKDKTLLGRYASLQADGDRATRGCFARRAEKDDRFPTLVAQAQALIDALPKE
jgi:hypothetical protein